MIKRPKQPPLTQVQSNRRNTQVYEFFRSKLKQVMFIVPRQIPLEAFEDAIPIEREKPFNTLITKEIQRYNLLIRKVTSNLEATLAAIEGHRQHDSETEDTFDCIQQERTPQSWMTYAYPCH